MTQIAGIVVGTDDLHAGAEHDAIAEFNPVGGLDVAADTARKAHGDVLSHGDALRKHHTGCKVYGHFAGAVDAKDSLSDEIRKAYAELWNEPAVIEPSRESGSSREGAEQAMQNTHGGMIM